MLPRAFFALVFGVGAIALSACGGGGSSTGALPASYPTSGATAAANPTAAPSPTPTSDIPIGAGQSFAYSGTLTQTQLRLIPAPMPTATTVSAVQQTGTVKDQQSFNGITGLYDASVAESDTTALETSTSQTDTYIAFSSPAPDGSTSLLDYGSTWADDNNDSLSYTYATPLVLGHLPEKAGDSWSNTAAVTILENESSDANGSAFFSKQVVAANGSYTETTTFPSAYGPADGESVITQNADGSGSITNVAGVGAIVYTTPQPQSNGQYILPYAVYAVPSPGPGDQPIGTGAIGAWYTVPSALYQENDSDLGLQPIPAACNVASSTAASAMETQRVITRVDTILGYTETQTTSEYRVPSLGAVCVQLNDTQHQYYDFNGDSQFILSPSSNPADVPAPIQVTTTVETLGLSSGVSPQTAHRKTASASAITPLSIQQITAAQMRFYDRVRRLRDHIKSTFVRAFASYVAKHQGAVR